MDISLTGCMPRGSTCPEVTSTEPATQHDHSMMRQITDLMYFNLTVLLKEVKVHYNTYQSLKTAKILTAATTTSSSHTSIFKLAILST